MTILQTDRLILRNWCAADRQPFARMNADAKVMEFLPATLTNAESDSLAEKIEEHIQRRGFGLFATELRSSHSFIGFIGLAIPTFQAAFTPCVEVGWRLSAIHWGKGLATEGAREVVRHAFRVLGLDELVSFTVPANIRSRRVMEKLGMTHDAVDDFDHPKLPEGHPLRRHVLYRLKKSTASLILRACLEKPR
jgi:ribosomal-protein-alanine N-acetyltransferase